MPDRTVALDASIYIDAPKLTVPGATVTVTDPVGGVVVTALPASSGGDGRLYATLPGTALALQGIYTAVWTGANERTESQVFSVGVPETGADLTLWDVRVQVAHRLAPVIRSVITDYDTGIVTDIDMEGGPGNYLNRWLALAPSVGYAIAGKAKRVADFSGSAFVLSLPFGTSPVSGDDYALFPCDPREVDAALRVAFKDLGQRVPVPVQLRLLLADQASVHGVDLVAVTLPSWLSHVDMVYNEGSEPLPTSRWELWPGRKLIFKDDAGGGSFPAVAEGRAITVSGMREFLPPRFDDSSLDVNTTALIARASKELLAARASGAGTDLREHHRRQLTAEDEWAANLPFATRRLPPGSRRVIP